MDDTANIVSDYCLGVQRFKGSDPRDALYYNITAIAALTYGLLTLLVNFRVYTVLLKNRKRKEFSSSFYTLFIIASIVDSCWWISNQLKDHVGYAPALHFMLSWIPAIGFVVSFWFFLLSYFMFANMLITVLVTLNRFLSIIFKNGDMMWKRVFPIGLLIAFLLPIVFTWGIWWNTVIKCTITILGELYYFINQKDEMKNGIPINLGEFIVSFSSSIINAILNLVTTISVIRQRKKISPNLRSKSSNKTIHGPEMKLLIISFIMFINQCSYSAIQLLLFLGHFLPNNPSRNARLVEISRFVIDILCLSPSWILIIMSKCIRKRILPRHVSTMVGSKAVTVVKAVPTN